MGDLNEELIFLLIVITFSLIGYFTILTLDFVKSFAALEDIEDE